MKKMYALASVLVIAGMIYSCGTADSKESKQAELDKYKAELAELEQKIADLESEISPEAEDAVAEILVSSLPIQPTTFYHEIEVRGSVQSRENVMISAETMGRVEKIHVEEGQTVKAGQLLIELDDDILRNNVAEIRTSLELAEAVFQRQKNLWDQNIGTELQYLKAKNNKETLERRLATLRTQLRQYRIMAPFGGSIDDIPVRIGEMIQPGMPAVRVLNPRKMYIQADVSEAYLGKFEAGDEAEVYFPIRDRRFAQKITSVSRVINPENRTFVVEINLPLADTFEYQPNQVVVVKMTDYVNESAITVPTRLIQSDSEGKYVFVIDDITGKTAAAKKVRITTGLSYQSRTEIKSGLDSGNYLIDEGFREVIDGAEVQRVAAN